MARSEHNREAYRALFGYLGAALQLFALLMIVISFPVAPAWVVLGLLALLIVAGIWSWRAYASSFVVPAVVGVVVAVVWMVVVGLVAVWWEWQ